MNTLGCMFNLNLQICLNLNLEFGVWGLGVGVCILKRSEHGAHVAGAVIIHYGENDGVHKSNHVLGAVGRDAQQHIRGKNVEEENEVEQARNVEHGLRDGVIIYHNKKK